MKLIVAAASKLMLDEPAVIGQTVCGDGPPFGYVPMPNLGRASGRGSRYSYFRSYVLQDAGMRRVLRRHTLTSC